MNIKKFSKTTLALSLICILALSCVKRKDWQVDLKPNDPRPVYAVRIGDNEEAEILQQEMNLEILQIANNQLYFLEPNATVMNSMKAIGYVIQKADPMQTYYRIVKVSKDSAITKDELVKQYDVQFINEEKDHYIFRGDLSQLKKMEDQGIELRKLTEEVRPRIVSIRVPGVADVQKVSEIQVDIFSAEIQADSSYIIHGQAFDYQIELMRDKNYTVQVQP